MEIHRATCLFCYSKGKHYISMPKEQSDLEMWLVANYHKSESELVLNCVKLLPGKAYQQVCFYLIKLHLVILLTGREQSERQQIPSTAGHQKMKKGNLRGMNSKIKDKIIHLSMRNSTEKGKREGSEKKKKKPEGNSKESKTSAEMREIRRRW